MKAELIVQINKFYHAFLADAVIYQSKFVEEWWEKEGWIKKTDVFPKMIRFSLFNLFRKDYY